MSKEIQNEFSFVFRNDNPLKVLVACEYSGVVRDAFLELGHDAWSCDLLDSDSCDRRHIKGDCVPVIVKGWDIIIMHPPCTALAVSGNAHYGEGMPKYDQRLSSVEWTKSLFNLAVEHAKIGVCMENPVGVLPRMAGLPCSQYIQPYQFGHLEQKKTGLWIHGLPLLTPELDVFEEMMTLPKRERERLHYLSPGKDRWKIRSTTFSGIAKAMARQWGGLNG